MNIFLHELKASFKSVIIWACSMTALAVMYVLIFKGLGSEIEAFKTFMQNMPEAMKKMFNIYIDSLSTLTGFYSFVFSFVLLCGAIQAMNLGTGILSKEIRDKTADFLMTKPVSREKILTSKLLAVFTSIVITNIIYLLLVISVIAAIIAEYDLKLFLLISLTLFFVQLIFAAIGVIISVIAGKIKSVISVSLSTVFGFYIIGSLGSVIGDENARYLSPFRYFDTAFITKNAGYETTFIIIGLIVIVASVVASSLIYVKKDIHTV